MHNYNSTRNGHNAWMALLNHYKGEAQKDCVKGQAYSNILPTKYHGEKKKFNFETYITIHQEAYEGLKQYSEHIFQEKRVCDLLTGIKDPMANAAKQAILATPHLRNSFTNAVTYLATSLQLNLALQDTRNIGPTNTKSGRGGRGGCRGGGHGGQGGGRGRGHGRNIYLGSYSPEQWHKLSAEDKKRVQEGRQRSADQRSQGGTQHSTQGGGGTGAKNLSIMGTNLDAQSAITLPTAIADGQSQTLFTSISNSANPDNKRSNPDNAGSHMSQRGLNKIITTQ